MRNDDHKNEQPQTERFNSFFFCDSSEFVSNLKSIEETTKMNSHKKRLNSFFFCDSSEFVSNLKSIKEITKINSYKKNIQLVFLLWLFQFCGLYINNLTEGEY